jgi:hypothetical protein
MSKPSLTGALEGLTTLGADDLARYKAAVGSGRQMGWGYYFPYLLSRNRPGRSAVLIAEDDGSLCLFQWSSDRVAPRLDLLFAPLPMNVPALERALERANDFNGDRSARVLRIDHQDAGPVASSRGVRVTPRRAQYLFAPTVYEALAGRKFHTVRRNVVLVERRPDVEVAPFVPAHAPACRALLGRWKQANRAAHGTAGGAGLSKRIIALAATLPERDLRGEVVLLDGRVVAFAFGGGIRPGLGCAFERKCDTEVRGLSYFQFRRLLLLLRDWEVVNDGSDAKREGLRQFKESFRPMGMHSEYRATQRRARRSAPGGARSARSTGSRRLAQAPADGNGFVTIIGPSPEGRTTRDPRFPARRIP